MIRSAVFITVLLALFCPAEIPPYYPPATPLAPRNTTIRPDELSFISTTGVKVTPRDFHETRSLNGAWKFSGVERSAHPFADETRNFETVAFDDSGWDTIAVPLNWYQKYQSVYKKDEPYVRGFYRQTITLSEKDLSENRRVLLRFDNIGYEATLWVNGHKIGNRHGEFIPAEFDITNAVHPGNNLLAVRVISDFGTTHGTVDKTRHTYGSQFSFRNIKAGIWGDAKLIFSSAIRFRQIQIIPDLTTGKVRICAEVEQYTTQPLTLSLGGAVIPAMKNLPERLPVGESTRTQLEIAPGITSVELEIALRSPRPWSPDDPYLYYAVLFLEKDSKIVTAESERFGYREFTIRDGKFHLNGKRIYLFGENILSVGYGGYGNQTSQSETLYQTLAGFRSRGYNLIRTAHMPIVTEALSIADEIGLMIYDEWGWSFTRDLDFPEFKRRNDKELTAWVKRDFNHPSVVMWSCGNEVRHINDTPIRTLLNEQVRLVHSLDAQKRPVVSFSGNAAWKGFGSEPTDTDVLDFHTYLGNSVSPWTHWRDYFDGYYSETLRQYQQKTTQLDRPYIIWETVGYSWGGCTDPTFKPNDVDAYAAYVRRPHSWAKSNGVGHIGTLGLAAALDPERGLDYGKRLYGHRLLELTRQDLRIDGFAPWFSSPGLDAATLWTQKIFCGLRDSRHLPPRNLFNDRPSEWEFYCVNSDSTSFVGGTITLSLLASDKQEITLGEFKAEKTAPFTLTSQPVTLCIPADRVGNQQLRVTLRHQGRIVSRNFYAVHLENGKQLQRPLPTPAAGKIALLDVGNSQGLKAICSLFDQWQLPYEIVRGAVIPDSLRLAVIPPGIGTDKLPRWEPRSLLDWVAAGGSLLILEQNPGTLSPLAQTSIIAAGNTLTDLVCPEHPIFRGLESSNFDTWNNPAHGYSIRASIAPFLRNALATRGAMNGSNGVENAIVEATHQKGSLLWSQLDAVALRESDSVAAAYLRNLFEYFCAGRRYAKVRPLDGDLTRFTRISPERLRVIDLSGHANRSFTDERANDGEGGWTDQGKNDFRKIPLGKQTVSGVDFWILDPEKNNGKSCLVLQGAERPRFPAEITGIPVKQRFSRIFFLHTAAWSTGDVGAYRIHYADGSSLDYKLRHGVNIGDWWNPSRLSDANPGFVWQVRAGAQVGSYVSCWENPHPNQEILSLDVLSAHSKLIREINFLPGRTAVPILIAATGELFPTEAVPVEGKVSGGGKEPTQKAVVAPIEAEQPDGTRGSVLKVEMPGPVTNPGKASFAVLRFEASKRKLAACRYLTFWIKSKQAGAIDLRIPETNWRGAMQTGITLVPDTWRRIRVDLDSLGREAWLKEGKELRGELFFYNGYNPKFLYPRPAVTFELTGVWLE